MDLKAALVLTTIRDPVLLEGYYANLQKYGHLDQVKVIVIPDRKTPAAAYERCAGLRKQGLNVACPSLNEQEEYLQWFGLSPSFIPYNSDNRRNVGYLMALEAGVDFLISIDDDNYCGRDDFFQAHAIVCSPASGATAVESTSGWFNVMDLLTFEPKSDVYPRGFPYYARHKLPDVRDRRCAATAVRMNAGLWLQDPDLDGITWLVSPARVTRFDGCSYVLGKRTWSPINSQNTALHRDVIPTYYFVRMGCPPEGFPIDRYGDIFSGYFSQACVRHLGHDICVGTPVVEHRRNSHNYLKDALNEFTCICMLEDLLPWLWELELEGETYCDVYAALSYLLEDVVRTFRGSIWSGDARAYFSDMAHCMREWVKVCRRVGSA